MDQRQANREAKRAALFLLPVDPPMPNGVENVGVERSDADRLREGWRRMRRQLERESTTSDAPAIVDDPDQIAAWSLADLRGPLCEDHEAPVAQVTWERQAEPRWERLRFACGCEREAPGNPLTSIG